MHISSRIIIIVISMMFIKTIDYFIISIWNLTWLLFSSVLFLSLSRSSFSFSRFRSSLASSSAIFFLFHTRIDKSIKSVGNEEGFVQIRAEILPLLLFFFLLLLLDHHLLPVLPLSLSMCINQVLKMRSQSKFSFLSRLIIYLANLFFIDNQAQQLVPLRM